MPRISESTGTFSEVAGSSGGIIELSHTTHDDALQRIPVVPRIDYLRHDSLLSVAALFATVGWHTTYYCSLLVFALQLRVLGDWWFMTLPVFLPSHAYQICR